MIAAVKHETPPGANAPPPPSDATLVKRAQKGELAAYDELVRRYQERIYSTLYHMTANHEDAGDLAQEAFVKAFRALKSFKGDSSFFTWVYRIAVNKTIKTPRRDVNLAELQERLNAAMQKLSEEHRLVVTLHDVQGLPHDEISKIMDCNVGTVRSRLFYARQQLQAHLSDYLK
jgi:RNA polymerase sigma-70 factor (ECF subfamily)